jgi:tRNA U34 5-carboxymethylaminomethyl modifying GTPase MnmE/TrmE
MRLSYRLLALQLDRNLIYDVKPKERHSLKIAIIGTPNVGKSALTNQLIKADLCAVSKLIDTTRRVRTLQIHVLLIYILCLEYGHDIQ